MLITIAHTRSKAEIIQAIDRSFADAFKPAGLPVQISMEQQSWEGSTLTFALKAKMGFVSTPIKGTVEVTDHDVTIDADLGMLGRFILRGQSQGTAGQPREKIAELSPKVGAFDMAEKFVGQVVLVAGGTGGLGRAVSLAFLAEGATVAVNYRKQAGFDALQSAAGASSRTPEGYITEVTDEAAIGAAVGRIIAKHGRLDAPRVNLTGPGLLRERRQVVDNRPEKPGIRCTH